MNKKKIIVKFVMCIGRQRLFLKYNTNKSDVWCNIQTQRRGDGKLNTASNINNKSKNL